MKERLSVYLTLLVLFVVLVGGLLLFSLSDLGGKGSSPDPSGKNHSNQWEVTEGITLHLLQDSYPPGTKSFTLVLENRSDNVMLYGLGWAFEKYENGEWKKVETIENISFPLIGYTLYGHSKNTLTIPTDFLKQSLSSGIYRVTGCSLRVAPDSENLSYGGKYNEYPPYQLVFTIAEGATPEPEPQPEKQLADWQLPEIESWQWYTTWDCINMYEKAGQRVWQFVEGENGLVAIIYSNSTYLNQGDLLLMDIFDRKTGKRYQVFTKPTVEIFNVTSYKEGFKVITDDTYYCYIGSNGKLVMTPLR